MSGAGRRLTCRSVAAWLARCVTVRGSRRYAAARAAAMMRPVPGAVEGPGVGREFLVDGGPVLRGQAGGFPDEEGGAPFVELPGLQRRESVRHLRNQGLRQAQEPAALGRGFAPGEGDLRADPGPEFGRGHPGVGLFAALEQVKGDGQTCLGLRRGRGRTFSVSPSCQPGCWSVISPAAVAGRWPETAAASDPGHPPRPSCRLPLVEAIVGPLLAVHECQTIGHLGHIKSAAAEPATNP